MNKSESKYFNTAAKMDEALIALLEKKDFDYISVKEICEAADVNRSTFYLHYSDIYNLLDEVENDMLKEIKHIIETHPMGEKDNTFTFMVDIFMVLEQNKEICKALMGDNGDANFTVKIKEIISENALKNLELLFPDIKDDL